MYTHIHVHIFRHSLRNCFQSTLGGNRCEAQLRSISGAREETRIGLSANRLRHPMLLARHPPYGHFLTAPLSDDNSNN